MDECELLLASDAFDAWKGAETLQVGDLVACNNSFWYRDSQSTKKGVYHLAIEVRDAQNFTLPPVEVMAYSRINSQLKRLAARERPKYEIDDLDTALSEQLPGLGSIVFSLAGRIGEPEAAQPPLAKVPDLDLLIYVRSTFQVSRAQPKASSCSDCCRPGRFVGRGARCRRWGRGHRCRSPWRDVRSSVPCPSKRRQPDR